MPVAARLLLPLAAALLPAVGLLALFEGEARRAREASVRDEAQRLAALVNADLSSIADGAQQTLAAFGSSEAVRGGDAAACDVHLQALLPQLPRYDNLLAADLDGRVFCSALAGVPQAGVADRAYFRRALEAGGFAVGDHADGRRSGRPAVHFAQPFRDRGGRVAGVVVASLELDWLGARLASLPLPDGASAAIADRNGTLLARRPGGGAFRGRSVAEDVLPLLRHAGPGVAEVVNVDGVRRTLGYVPPAAEPVGFYVGVGLDRTRALAGLAEANRRSVALILAGTALALGLGWLTAHRFVRRPVQALLGAAERWRAGDLTARAGADPALARERGRSDFGRLAAAFDAVAAAAAERERALNDNAKANARLAAVVAAAAEAIIGFAAEDGRILAWNRGAEDLFGYTEAEAVGGPVGLLVPPEMPEGDPTGVFAWAMAGRAVRDHETVRMAKGGERIPVSVTAARMVSRNGRVLGVSAIFRDLRARKAAEERQLLLMREVDHRAKNVLAVVQSVLRLTRATDQRSYAAAVEGRITALGRAHSLLAKGHWSGADVRQVAEEALGAYRGEGRVALRGPALDLAAEAVQPVSMVLHELATNAAKYGALSRPEGRLGLSWDLDPITGELRLVWEERGGPPVPGAPDRRGFGSCMIDATVRGQLGGARRCDWAPEGLRCEMTVAPKHLRRAGQPHGGGSGAAHHGQDFHDGRFGERREVQQRSVSHAMAGRGAVRGAGAVSAAEIAGRVVGITDGALAAAERSGQGHTGAKPASPASPLPAAARAPSATAGCR